MENGYSLLSGAESRVTLNATLSKSFVVFSQVLRCFIAAN